MIAGKCAPENMGHGMSGKYIAGTKTDSIPLFTALFFTQKEMHLIFIRRRLNSPARKGDNDDLQPDNPRFGQ